MTLACISWSDSVLFVSLDDQSSNPVFQVVYGVRNIHVSGWSLN